MKDMWIAVYASDELKLLPDAYLVLQDAIHDPRSGAVVLAKIPKNNMFCSIGLERIAYVAKSPDVIENIIRVKAK